MSIKKHYKKTLIGLGIAILLCPLIIAVYEVITTDKDAVVFFENYDPYLSIGIVIAYLTLLLLFVGLGLYWIIKQVSATLTLKKEQQKMELLHLQSQVNPHFFFNTLNNLYGLVGKDAEKAQGLILKLSDMMRYSIYKGQESNVTILEEVTYLKNYIELHKMRYHKEINVQFNTNIQDENAKIMPLLFINLLENAFKHGVENLYDHAFVKVDLTTTEEEIIFTVENNFDAETVNETKGIGLKNLKRRLELIYPTKHSLSFESKDELYKSKLTIQFS